MRKISFLALTGFVVALAAANPANAVSVRIDPNGREQGSGIDPNGRGWGIDPNGRDAGGAMDPNGLGWGIDPNGRDEGPGLDPNGRGVWVWLLGWLFGR